MRCIRASPKFATEAELCSRFISLLPKEWTAYAETAGWDILVVRNSDGFQVGIEAKLKLNAKVISQALEEDGRWRCTAPGPDCRAVLVPAGQAHEFERVCAYIGVTIIRCSHQNETTWGYRPRYLPELPTAKNESWTEDRWYECCPTRRCPLPEYVPDVEAGHPCPVQLTDWKIRALRLYCVLEFRGYLTRRDFRMLRLDHRRWVPSEWLSVEGRGDLARYVAGPKMPMPHLVKMHPTIYQQIKDDAPNWWRLLPHELA